MTRYIQKPSPNFDARTRPIDLVVLHYTGMQDAEIALARLTDPAPVAGRYPGPWQSDDVEADAPLSKVSVHYVVDEAGQIYSLVPEEHRAWHAGVASWDGDGDVNARSIGIEIVNGGHDFGLPDFTDAQIDGVIGLLKDIFERWPQLNATRVVGHSDVAPARKISQSFDEVVARSPLPWLHIAEVVAAQAAAQGYRRLGLTGTRWLVDSDVYPAKLAAQGLAVVRPQLDERQQIDRIIMDELVCGVFKPESVACFQQVILRLKDAGCDAVILGCTEIPLIINDANSALPTLDSTRLLARAALRRAVQL